MLSIDRKIELLRSLGIALSTQPVRKAEQDLWKREIDRLLLQHATQVMSFMRDTGTRSWAR